jgi:hypothetical protein
MTTRHHLPASDLDEPFADEPRASQAIPPPPFRGVSEVRLAQNKAPAVVPVYGAVFVWGQGDAYALPRDVTPASDISELHPQLRDTVRPGRCA